MLAHSNTERRAILRTGKFFVRKGTHPSAILFDILK
jgi:hypothetical protein